MRSALIFGAGKIGRGFLGHLLHRSGYALHFVDPAEGLIALLNRERRYRIDIAGRDGSTEYIPVASALAMSDAEAVARAWVDADLVLSAVGAANIDALARFVKPMLMLRGTRPLDWLICENADRPANAIRRILMTDSDEALRRYVETGVGLVETQILRSGMTADPDILRAEPLALRMQDWWTLPADAEAFRSGIPAIEGLEPRIGFENELTRKLYTFNGLNGPIAYLGYANGHSVLHEAATDPRLELLFRTIMAESSHGLIAEFGFDADEHRQFQRLAWEKYRDPAINDSIARNARDTARKLGPGERLIGPATLCLKHGRSPDAYAAAIAAAIEYDGSDDPGTGAVRALCAQQGVAAVLERYSGVARGSRLCELVVEAHHRRRYRLSSRV